MKAATTKVTGMMVKTTFWWMPLCPGLLGLFLSTPLLPQEPSSAEGTEPLPSDAVLLVEPQELELEVGETAQLVARLVDRRGEEIEGRTVVFYSRSRRQVGVNPAGEVEAYGPGRFEIVALVPKDPMETPRRADAFLKVEIPVTVPDPPVEKVSLLDLPRRLYAGTSVELEPEVIDTSGVRRHDVELHYRTSDPEVAQADAFGFLSLVSPGTTTLTVRAEDAAHSVEIRVEENPVVELELASDATRARTGDVVRFHAVGLDADGNEVELLPVQYALATRPDPAIVAPGSSALLEPDGTFVAERSGVYSVVAVSGPHTATRRIRIAPRRVRGKLELVGQGAVRDRHTSDLWVWEGTDGRDYAITGTWGADGHAYVWDVTHPESITLIDAVQVDARTVNDVKVSEDGRLAVISREGASNRKNGIVLLDVSEPRVGVRILSRYDDQLKGGVHNVFVHDRHVYALSNGRRFDVLSLANPRDPYRVGRFELDTPGHGIHDVWVEDGIAYTSNWHDGVVAIDVGGGGAGGSPGKPVPLGSYAYPSGWNHAAFPYRSQSTGTFYVFAGDEAFPYGLSGRTQGQPPPRAEGWIHVIEWENWDTPREVARYRVPEAGSHNFWIEDDILYAAFYNGGLRVVDVSGELRGDLYRQGREIAVFMPNDPEGFLPNAPFVWGPQPYKDHIFFSDWNSGLWAVKLTELEDPERIVGEPQ